MATYGEPWTVSNAEPGGGTMSLVTATTESVNAVYAQLGPRRRAARTSRRRRTRSGSPAPSTVTRGGDRRASGRRLAARDVERLRELRRRRRSPRCDRDRQGRVPGRRRRRRGQGRRVRATPRERGCSPTGSPAEVTDILKTVLDAGTAAGHDIPCPAAGKTGTTDGQTDAWFVGYTPRISTAVWVGYPDSRTSMGSVRFRRQLRRPGLAAVHVERDRQLLRGLPAAAESVLRDELLELAHGLGRELQRGLGRGLEFGPGPGLRLIEQRRDRGPDHDDPGLDRRRQRSQQRL